MLTSTEHVEPIVIPPLCEAPDEAAIEVMTCELAELEKKPVHGWDVHCPTLYKTIYALTEELCSRANCTKPNLFIGLTGINKHQASAHLMMDGTTQLHLGVDFVKTFLLAKSSENRALMYRAFRWTLAHEVGHLCDPLFKKFGRFYNVRRIFNQLITGLFLLGMVSLIPGAHLVLGAVNSALILAISMSFAVLQKVVLILLHRKFEYFADAKSVGIIDDLDFVVVERALTTMDHATRSAIIDPYEHAPDRASQLLGAYGKKFAIAKLSLGHPSINKRMQRLQKILIK